MAEEFARRLYKSKAWARVRARVIARAHGVCEECNARPGAEVHHVIFLTPENIDDPEIALGLDNLKYLCRSCHETVHSRAAEVNRARKVSKANAKIAFDENGNLIKRGSVFIVWGAPASGKSTYVKEHAGRYDLLIDLDRIKDALTVSGDARKVPEVLPFALEVRELLYRLVAERTHYYERIWIVAGLSKAEERRGLASRLGAVLVHVDTDRETCKLHAQYDDTRKDKQAAYKITDRYFDTLTQ